MEGSLARPEGLLGTSSTVLRFEGEERHEQAVTGS